MPQQEAARRRRLGFVGRLTLLALAQALVAGVAAGAAAVVWPRPWAVAAAAALASGAFALVYTGRALSSAGRTLQAVTDGVRSFRDTDFSMRLAETRDDELGELVALYNQMGDALRSERHEIYQRELLLDTLLQGAPMAIVLAGRADGSPTPTAPRATSSAVAGAWRGWPSTELQASARRDARGAGDAAATRSSASARAARKRPTARRCAAST